MVMERTRPRLDRREAKETGEATRILLAEDDADMRELLAYSLRTEGYDVVACEDGLRLAEEVGSTMIPDREEHYDLIVSDLRLPGVTGMEILAAVNEWAGSPPLVLITAFGDEATHAEAERLGVAAFLDKPFEMDRLLETVRAVLASGPECAG
jgi:DNA-binding response OmpR family regulator